MKKRGRGREVGPPHLPLSLLFPFFFVRASTRTHTHPAPTMPALALSTISPGLATPRRAGPAAGRRTVPQVR